MNTDWYPSKCEQCGTLLTHLAVINQCSPDGNPYYVFCDPYCCLCDIGPIQIDDFFYICDEI
ncbi:MAG: hypothetical protein ACW980_24050 [Promethearchaeota archaeon]|jgi:hypothetical protein